MLATLIIRENIIKWDMAETAKGGPFQEILDGECETEHADDQSTSLSTASTSLRPFPSSSPASSSSKLARPGV